MSYVNPQGWGNQHTNNVANQVDHIADKIGFATDMVNNASMSLDSLQQELMAIANSPYPPNQSQITQIATRIATSKRQIDDGLNKIKEMARTIDQQTDNIQTPHQRGGW